MTIHPLLPVWLILLLLSALLVAFAILEWRRPLRFLMLRLVACAVAIASLAIIFLRPANRGAVNEKIILLTEGASHTVADSLRKIFPDVAFYQLGGVPYRSARMLNSYRDLFKHPSAQGDALSGLPGRVVAIAGRGLPYYAIDSIRNGFLYLPSAIPSGITKLSLPEDIRANRQATIGVTYQCTEIPASLIFTDPAGRKDSLILSKEKGSYSFSFTPLVQGQSTCSLTLIDGKGKRIEETLPLNVEPTDQVGVLILQSAPTFELQHLKNYLSDRGHQVAMRAQLSRNIFRSEFANRAKDNLSKITVPLLKGFDVLLVDPTALLQLSPAERSAVTTAVRNGLGMITVFNGTPSKMPPHDALPFTFAPVQVDTASVVLNGKRFALPATPLRLMEPAPVSNAGVGTTNVISRSTSRILSGFAHVREGATGFQLLRETYSILLSGDSTAYGLLWTPLIDAVTRTRHQAGSIRLVNDRPVMPNAPMYIDIISRTTPGLFADSVAIPPVEDFLVDGLWHATTWTERTGWHTLRTETDTLPYYVFKDQDWQALRITEQQRLNYEASMQPVNNTIGTSAINPISLTAFWIAFLLSTGFLWLAPKL